ncbi:MAG: RIP metalloprotease RseP, partial [Desulfobacterota bacterium]|nr:RIP metalloprotease RseP [Thermodesulfobacteriota bacterium]
MVTVISFLILIGILVFIHEFGHFIVAKLIGVKVEKFSLGFGPKLVGFKGGKDKTEYLISLLPLGGYVKLKGENPDEALNNDPSEFTSRKVSDRFKIVIAGSMMNIVLAFLLFPIVFMIGVEVPKYLKEKPIIGWIEESSPAAKAGFKIGDQIDQIAGIKVHNWDELQQVVLSKADKNLKVLAVRDGIIIEKMITPLNDEGFGAGYVGWGHYWEPIIGGLTPEYPAEKAGLQPGDKILAINSIPITHWNQVPQLIQKNKGKEIKFEVKRGEYVLSFLVKPELQVINGEKRPFVGIIPKIPTLVEKYGVFKSIQKGVQKAGEMTWLTLKMLKDLVTFNLSVKALGGPIMIAKLSGQAAKSGISDFLAFMAFLSLSLGIINLFPIPVLDGG